MISSGNRGGGGGHLYETNIHCFEYYYKYW